MSLADRIRQARAYAGMTQQQLADKIGMRQQSLAALETGKSARTSRLFEIAMATMTRAAWLADGSGPMEFVGRALTEAGSERGLQNEDEMRDVLAAHTPIAGVVPVGENGWWDQKSIIPDDQPREVAIGSSDPYAYCLEIGGDVYYPAIRSSWIVLVEPSFSARPGEYALLRSKDQFAILELLWTKGSHAAMQPLRGGGIGAGRMTLLYTDIQALLPIAALLPPSAARPVRKRR